MLKKSQHKWHINPGVPWLLKVKEDLMLNASLFCAYRKKSFLFSALYAAFILGGRHVMKQREKFELRKPLVLWSLTLAVFR